MLLHRHRLTTLVELSALERILQGPERLLGEENAALLVKAAYDDATEAARAEFMARIKSYPETAWPWSAMQSMAPRGGGGGGGGGGGDAGPGAKLVLSAKPELYAPAALILIRGQAESADADPGDRLPDRAAPEGVAWLPLHHALDVWDTKAILAWVGPQGWMIPAAAQVAKGTGNGATPPGGEVQPNKGGALPVPQPPASGSALTWKHPAVLAAGGVVVVAGAVALFNASQQRDRRRLEEALEAQEEQQ